MQHRDTSEGPGEHVDHLADYRHLTDATARRSIEAEHGIFVVEGILALRQLLRSPYRIRSIAVAEHKHGAVLQELAAANRDPHGVLLLVESREELRRVTGFDVHRGVLAAADRNAPLSPSALLSTARRVVAAESVNDNENMGALFRNAAALGIDGVLLDHRCADPLYRRSIRVSAGWTLRLPHARLDPGGSLPRSLAEHGLRPVALTPDTAATPVDEAAAAGVLDDPVAFVVGAEGPGLSAAVLDACDHRVRIPMAGGVDSLNVATSLAVVASFAAARGRSS